MSITTATTTRTSTSVADTSCSTCCNFVGADESRKQGELFGRSLGVDVCLAKSKILAINHIDEMNRTNLYRSTALSCESFMKEVPVTVGTLEDFDYQIAEEDFPGLMGKPAVLSSCRSCDFSVSAEKMYPALGIGVSFCRVKGIVVPRESLECKDCEFASSRTVNSEDFEFSPAKDIKFLSRFSADFKPDKVDLVQVMKSKQGFDVDPTEYESAFPLNDDHKNLGYRAFREIQSPDGKQKTFLPIFSESYFTDEEKLLIPATGSDEHPELYIDYFGGLYDFAVEAFELKETILLIGQPGVGKTEFCRWLAWMMQIPFHRYQMGKFTDVEDLIGSPQVDSKVGTYFKEGRLPRAWRRPGIIDVDEINLARGEIREFFRPLTDNSKQFVLDADHGVTVERHHGCFLLFTMNPAWDHRNTGTEDFAAADSNRLSPIWMDMPPDYVEKDIIRQRCLLDGYEIEDSTIDTIMKIGVDLRGLFDGGQFQDFWGTRQSIKVSRKTRWYPMPKAFQRASLDFYEPEVIDEVMKVVHSYVS